MKCVSSGPGTWEDLQVGTFSPRRQRGGQPIMAAGSGLAATNSRVPTCLAIPEDPKRSISQPPFLSIAEL